MRIISGSLGGRQFNSSRGHRTHPMSDKIRGALFGVLGDISGLTVLDAFAGTGALAFEALSRAAARALLLDNDRAAQQTIEQNIQALGLTGKARLIKAPAATWSDAHPHEMFDIVLCDPPYDKLQIAAIQKLVRHVTPGGTLVLSWPGDITAPEFTDMILAEQKSYGDAQLVFYK